MAGKRVPEDCGSCDISRRKDSAGEAIVDLAVAIVVFVVADLGGGFGGVAVDPCASGAGFVPVPQLFEQCCVTPLSMLPSQSSSLLLQVSVIGLTSPEASTPLAVDAGGCAFFAGEGVSGALGACIAGLGLTALADITSALVVFDAVAVVVKIVAGFGAWSDFAEAKASEDTRRTGLQAFFTDTFSFGPCGAAITIAGNVFVDFAVAIVVFVVADLDVGFDLPNACAPDPVVAGFFAFFADAVLICSCAGPS